MTPDAKVFAPLRVATSARENIDRSFTSKTAAKAAVVARKMVRGLREHIWSNGFASLAKGT
jgi:hypothetical protein